MKTKTPTQFLLSFNSRAEYVSERSHKLIAYKALVETNPSPENKRNLTISTRLLKSGKLELLRLLCQDLGIPEVQFNDGNKRRMYWPLDTEKATPKTKTESVIVDQRTRFVWDDSTDMWRPNKKDATIYTDPSDAHRECQRIYKLDGDFSRQLHVDTKLV